MFRLQWSIQNISPNFSGDQRSPNIRMNQTSPVTLSPSKLVVDGIRPSYQIQQQIIPKSTNFFQNTGMLQRIDPRLNNTKCMSCGKGVL
jgi:hypothetical protein